MGRGEEILRRVGESAGGERRHMGPGVPAGQGDRLIPRRSGARRIALADGVIVLAFGLLALMHHLGRWGGGYPFSATGDFTYLDGDAAQIASFAAAWDHPDLFRGDEVLSDQGTFRIYSTIHIPILRGLARLVGDYGGAFVSLLSLHVLTQALGFYVLGRVLFRRRYWATLLAVVTLMPVELNLGEYWGIYRDPLPRSSFQALLPYVLAAAFRWRSEPRRWPWLMVAAGALIYVHPVSAPAWGFALWLGLWPFHPQSWSVGKRVRTMLLLGALFLGVTFPFLGHYLRNHAHGRPPEGISAEAVYKVMALRYDTGFLDLPKGLRDFVGLWRDEWLYWAWAGAGFVLLMLWLRRDDRRSVSLVGLWTAGLLIVSVAIPVTEQAILRAYGLLPVELDLIRGVRYIVPLMLLFCLWPLSEGARKLEGSHVGRWAACAPAAVGALLVAVWIDWHQPDQILHAARCWTEGKIVCVEWPENERDWRPVLTELVEALEAVRRDTPPGSTILNTDYASTDYGLEIRYRALRPVVWTWKDGGILGYSNHAALIEWYGRYQGLGAAKAEKSPEAQVRKLLALARSSGAQYVFVELTWRPGVASVLNSFRAEVIWSNKSFALLKAGTPLAGDTVW
jgi:hypothetical protein